MEKTIESKIRYHQLYDCYGTLLTEKQKTAFEYYYLDDYSLSEIAELLSVSRNAVYEQITIATNYLDDYESKLHLLEKNQLIESLINSVRELDSLPKELEPILKKLETWE
jgi:predicted DNA-binding protein YlxM (UPF0122 family)